MINDLSKPGLIARKIEDEGLVEDRVQRSLLHVRLLLRDPLTIVHQVDLHVRICKKYFRFFIYFSSLFLAILNVGLLEKRHWKQLHKKELHFSWSFCQEGSVWVFLLVFFYFFLCLSPDPDAVRSGFYEIAKKMCGIPIYSGRMPLSEITENLVQWLRQEKISRNNPTRKYRCRKNPWNVFLFFLSPLFPIQNYAIFISGKEKQTEDYETWPALLWQIYYIISLVWLFRILFTHFLKGSNLSYTTFPPVVISYIYKHFVQ